jgi:hypothetical protein
MLLTKLWTGIIPVLHINVLTYMSQRSAYLYCIRISPQGPIANLLSVFISTECSLKVKTQYYLQKAPWKPLGLWPLKHISHLSSVNCLLDQTTWRLRAKIRTAERISTQDSRLYLELYSFSFRLAPISACILQEGRGSYKHKWQLLVNEGHKANQESAQYILN